MDWTNEAAVKQWLSARATRNPVIESLRDSYDPGDSWGSTLLWHFGICDVMLDLSIPIPEHWEFTPAMGGSDDEAWEYQAAFTAVEELSRAAQARALTQAGEILHRYAIQLRLAGMDY